MNLSRVAAKLLTASDLTLFSSHFHKEGQRSKQKAINLNADVFVSEFYPGLRDRFAELHFGLTIVGPGGAPPHVLSRKAIRSERAKNWRLNGELIGDPVDQAGRFAQLKEGDVVVLAFEGTEQPEQVVMVLLSQELDARLCTAIIEHAKFDARESMRSVQEEDLRRLFASTGSEYPAIHPLELLVRADSVEDAVYGSQTLIETVIKTNGRGAAVSQESVRRQVGAAAETGERGEEAFERWLCANKHGEADFEWVSRVHARAAFDFEVRRPRWEASKVPLFIDVKSTKGAHSSGLHVSQAELRWAAQHPSYRIARVSSLTTSSAEVRILTGVTELARTLLESLGRALPRDVRMDSLEIAPQVFKELYKGVVEWNDAE